MCKSFKKEFSFKLKAFIRVPKALLAKDEWEAQLLLIELCICRWLQGETEF